MDGRNSFLVGGSACPSGAVVRFPRLAGISAFYSTRI